MRTNATANRTYEPENIQRICDDTELRVEDTHHFLAKLFPIGDKIRFEKGCQQLKNKLYKKQKWKNYPKSKSKKAQYYPVLEEIFNTIADTFAKAENSDNNDFAARAWVNRNATKSQSSANTSANRPDIVLLS
ncbi:hypothetical protein VKT23_019443 [Stygiomarasmius scandens]|uniref:Uncharacterized protein n=1 Tax=Marasmiellus scandens TaxID=2682957 RepID=A0ABR1ILQ5_9AGAR